LRSVSTQMRFANVTIVQVLLSLGIKGRNIGDDYRNLAGKNAIDVFTHVLLIKGVAETHPTRSEIVDLVSDACVVDRKIPRRAEMKAAFRERTIIAASVAHATATIVIRAAAAGACRATACARVRAPTRTRSSSD